MTLEERKEQLRIQRRRVRLYSDILRAIYGIVNCLVTNKEAAQFVKNNIKSIAFNVFELYYGEENRPKGFD